MHRSKRCRTTNPTQLAEEVMKVVGDVDSNTAHTALEIAKLLLIHRETAARQFVNDQSCSQSDLGDCSTG